jgi:hypothetical protein
VNDVEGQAAKTRAEEAEKYGQVSLTEAERERIDFTRTDIPTARAAKGIAVGRGVDDFVSYFDPELTVDEHRQVFEQAATEGGGQRGGRERMDEREVDRRIAEGSQTRQQEELGRAKEFAFEDADPEAREFLTECGPRSQVFDIHFSREEYGSLRGSGADFDRLMDRHERRASRAQTVDETRTAPITRDPFEWTDAPDNYDYPGVDTVDPAELHEQRSERAKTVDEREIAPQAETKQQWAMSPDRYDWKRVDGPDTYGPTMDESIPSVERNTDAPEPLTTQLSKRDVSLSPEEAFEGVGAVSQEGSSSPVGLAEGREADIAFIEAEERRMSTDVPPEVAQEIFDEDGGMGR